MGRVYDKLKVDGQVLWTLFDTGAVRSYITARAAAASGIEVKKLPKPYDVSIGGARRRLGRACLLLGTLPRRRRPIDALAYVVESLGKDERGRTVDVLFGTETMETWNIRVDPKAGRIDLSRLRKEFVEW